jgi:hypothetical protein
VTVAAGRGIYLTGEDIFRLPMEFDSYSATRSESLEQAAANALLGKGSLLEGPGGGVNIYRGERGQLSFRRGGALELDLPWSGQILDGAACAELLTPAGLDMENALVENGDNGVTLTQRYRETVIVNSRLTCTVQEGTLQVRGRWLLPQELTAGGSSLSRATDGGVGDNALHGLAVGVGHVSLDEGGGGLGHVHGLILQGFTNAEAAAVNRGADTNGR